MTKKIIYSIILMIVLVISSSLTYAGSDEDLAAALYNYYQADMDSDIDTLISMTDTSHVPADEKDIYLKETRNILKTLDSTYTTKDFEITDVNIFSDGTDAKVIYHLRSTLETTDNQNIMIDNAFVTIMHDSGDGWKIRYTIPKSAYEEQDAILDYLEQKIESSDEIIGQETQADSLDSIYYIEEEKEEDDSILKKIFNFIVKIFKTIFTSSDTERDTSQDEYADRNTKEDIDRQSTDNTLPTTTQSTKTEEEALAAFHEYVLAFNKMQEMVRDGKNNTPEGQQAYEAYKITLKNYEDIRAQIKE